MNLLSNTLYDVAIIGAGIAGTYCASVLQKAGYRVCLIEKDEALAAVHRVADYPRKKRVFNKAVI